MQTVKNSQPSSKRGMGQSQPVGGQRSNSVPSVPSAGSSSSSSFVFPGPMVLTPVSQLGNTPRRNSRAITQRELADRAAAANFDPEQYNPDGSLRTIHKMPAFDQSYAQAQSAYYIRHSQPQERERELSVKEIFGGQKK